jgi:hypothetical protein
MVLHSNGGGYAVEIPGEGSNPVGSHQGIPDKIEILMGLKAVHFALELFIGLKNGEIKRSHQVLMHPGLVLGILVAELSFPGKHKIYQQDSSEINKNNPDGIPEPGNAFIPVHGVNLKYLLQLLTSPLYFCSKACKLHILQEKRS